MSKCYFKDKPLFLFPAFLLSIGLLIALHIKRKETPINLILLAAFTVVEAYTVGNKRNVFLITFIRCLPRLQESWSPSSTRVS